MKKFLRFFALMAIFLMGSVTTEAATLLTYDFKTVHPSGDTGLEGRKYYDGRFAYWGGTWSGFFGKKIAFDSNYSSGIILLGTGGLKITESKQRMYITDLEVGDKVKITFTGTATSLLFHSSSTCTLKNLAKGSSFVSDLNYETQSKGYICIENQDTEGVISKIQISSIRDSWVIDTQYGIATMSANVPLNFSDVAAKAYIATGFSDGKFTFTQVKYVPSNVGVLVITDRNQTTISVPVGRGLSLADNLVPSSQLFFTTAESTLIHSNNPGEAYYIVGRSGGKNGIFKINSTTFVNSARHAYLKVSF